MMWFPTRERVLKRLTTLAADSFELEQQAGMLSKRFAETNDLFGEFTEFADFRRELSDTTQALMIAGEAVLSGQVAPKAMAKNLPMFGQQIEAYRQTLTGILKSVIAIGAVG